MTIDEMLKEAQKDAMVREYILSRQHYLDGEMKRDKETLEQIISWSDPKCYAREIGRLEARIDSYENELNALMRFLKRWEEDE